MKPSARSVAAATRCSFANWFLAILCAVFCTIISASSAVDSQTGAKELTPTEQWVVAQATAGKVANLARQFPADKRKLSAAFLKDLLTGEQLGFNPSRNGVRIIGALIDEPIDLTSAQIPCDVELTQCQFNKDVIFKNAKVEGHAFFNGSVFEGQVSFTEADIAQDFSINFATYQGQQHDLSFVGMKVGRDAFFNGTVFEEAVYFDRADIANDFYVASAKFQNKQSGASFNSMKVGGSAWFALASFDGPVDFQYAKLGNLSAENAQFNGEEQIRETTGFDWSKIAMTNNFESIKCEGSGFFGGAIFKGSVSFAKSSFLDLLIGKTDLKSGPASIPQLDLSFTSIKRRLQISRIRVRNLIASWLRVEGQAEFSDLTVEHYADLHDSDFAVLNLSQCNWPKRAKGFRIYGLNFKALRAADEQSESHKVLLKLAGQSDYSPDVYGNLEAFFKREGSTADADQAFIEGKCRERKKYRDDGDWSYWLGSWVLDLLVGYGRHPGRAAILCTILVALGCILFAPKKMEPQNPEETPRVYSRFWYSLGLFLPFVDLQANKVWKPKADRTVLRHYMRVHILLGWILIPIVLAALTGIIK